MTSKGTSATSCHHCGLTIRSVGLDCTEFAMDKDKSLCSQEANQRCAGQLIQSSPAPNFQTL